MAISEEVALWSTSRQAAAIRAGEFGSRELLELLVSRIERINGTINAVVTLDLETAREAADGADRMAADGEFAGPLHGVPITIKDALETAGICSTGGATELTDNVPGQDAPVVAALKEAETAERKYHWAQKAYLSVVEHAAKYPAPVEEELMAEAGMSAAELRQPVDLNKWYRLVAFHLDAWKRKHAELISLVGHASETRQMRDVYVFDRRRDYERFWALA